jgi:hypothetical protein
VLRQGEIEFVCLLLSYSVFLGTGLDLVEQDITRPAEAGGGAEIPEAGGWVCDPEKSVRMMDPRDAGNHFSHNV